MRKIAHSKQLCREYSVFLAIAIATAFCTAFLPFTSVAMGAIAFFIVQWTFQRESSKRTKSERTQSENPVQTKGEPASNSGTKPDSTAFSSWVIDLKRRFRNLRMRIAIWVPITAATTIACVFFVPTTINIIAVAVLFIGQVPELLITSKRTPSQNSAPAKNWEDEPQSNPTNAQSQDSASSSKSAEEELTDPETERCSTAPSSTPNLRHYREQDLQRIVASLKANSAILVVGEQGSGKSVLATAVVAQLAHEDFPVAFCEPTTPKQMLVDIAVQLGVSSTSLEGKSLTAEALKQEISLYFLKNVGFLVIDDAQNCELKFRLWLKNLKCQGVPMLLLATDPPKSDVFLCFPRIGLQPLPDYAIRELMEQEALSRGLNLKTHDLARLQERAGGNPGLAIRTIQEEYLGLEVEAGDHRRYADATPLILLVGVAFVVIRFIGLGTGDQALYIFGGIVAAVFLGVARLMYNLPKEGRKIQS